MFRIASDRIDARPTPISDVSDYREKSVEVEQAVAGEDAMVHHLVPERIERGDWTMVADLEVDDVLKLNSFKVGPVLPPWKKCHVSRFRPHRSTPASRMKSSDDLIELIS